VRALVKQVLEEKGYTVLAAASGGEALRLAMARPGGVDLLVTDIVMPGMTGRQLRDRLVQEQPGLPTVFMSGFTDRAQAGDGEWPADAVFLQKPFALDTLARRVRDLLDAAATDAPSTSP
jgi:CheY-like chemotaxis protein